jgi:hypothetical protein
VAVKDIEIRTKIFIYYDDWVTVWKAEESGFDSRQGKEINLFSTALRPPTVSWTNFQIFTRHIFRRVKRLVHETATHLRIVP